MILQQLQVQRAVWPILLFASGGRLPTTDEGFNVLVTQIKTQCHMLEMTHSGPRTLEEGWKRPAETGSYFMDDDNGAQSAWFGTG
eukprot:6035249-Heterocapsa_arctica.AAC.1